MPYPIRIFKVRTTSMSLPNLIYDEKDAMQQAWLGFDQNKNVIGIYKFWAASVILFTNAIIIIIFAMSWMLSNGFNLATRITL